MHCCIRPERGHEKKHNRAPPIIFSRRLFQIKLLFKQVAQWATIAQLEVSIMFGDTLKYDTQRKVTLNLKQ